MRRSSRQGFTLFEILAVLFLIVIGFSVAIGVFSGKKASIRRASQQLTQDIQGLYVRSIQESKIFRISFPPTDSHKYLIEEFRMPMAKPKEEDREAFAKWEEYQREIDALSADDRKKRTRMDRGSFKVKRERELPGSVEFEKILSSRFKDEKTSPSLFFMPSGDMDQALIILRVDDLKYSLKTNPLSGRVTLVQNEVTEQEWKKETQTD